jgi:hypothetical protein
MRNAILKRAGSPLAAFALIFTLGIFTLGCNQSSTGEKEKETETPPESSAPASKGSGGGSAASGGSPAPRANAPAANTGSGSAGSSLSGSAPSNSGWQEIKPVARRAVLDSGTNLRVRTTNTLSTKSAQSGEAFTASLEEPLVDGDWVIAPKGSTVRGTVVESDPGGRVKGVASLAIRLTELETADGQTININSSTFATEAQTTKKKDAVKVGIASGVGAAIGAIAGGGKGAAVGAGVGAGAGTGAVLATQGDAAVIPSETVLNFMLRDPVTITKR